MSAPMLAPMPAAMSAPMPAAMSSPLVASNPPGLPLPTLLALLQLASPALPVGGFAYSQGLEQAIEQGRVRDAESALG